MKKDCKTLNERLSICSTNTLNQITAKRSIARILSPFLALPLETVGGRGKETSTESWSRGKETKAMWQLHETVILSWILDQKGKRCCWESRGKPNRVSGLTVRVAAMRTSWFGCCIVLMQDRVIVFWKYPLTHWGVDGHDAEAKWESLRRVWPFVALWTVQSMNSPGQNTGVGSLSLLPGIFPTQVSHTAGGFFTS